MGRQPPMAFPRAMFSLVRPEVTSPGRCPSRVTVKLARELRATSGKRSPECYGDTVEVESPRACHSCSIVYPEFHFCAGPTPAQVSKSAVALFRIHIRTSVGFDVQRGAPGMPDTHKRRM